MDARLMQKLQKVMALAKSGVEGEAQAAASILAKLLQEHNLSVADLEKKGAHAPSVAEQGHDLGKAAFRWKLDLAEAIAGFYYCLPMVDRASKTVAFVGRPDNVESLILLYKWLMDQVAQVAREERRRHFDTTGEHVDPLRWQINFGVGAVRRLSDRLSEEKTRRTEDMSRNDLGEVTALVLHHDTENQDHLERTRGYRTDGQQTQKERERSEKYAKQDAEWQALLKSDPQKAYLFRPWERPETEEQIAARAAQQAKEQAEIDKREARNAARRARYEPKERYNSAEAEERKQREYDQSRAARRSGEDAAGRINLQPFLNGQVPTDAPRIKGKKS